MNATVSLADISAVLNSGKFPKAKKIAVENFVFSSKEYGDFANSMNLSQDARAYNWNADTVGAIKFLLKIG